MAANTCPNCGVHRRICVCDQCRPVLGAPELWVLQHPAEQGHSKGTLRVAQCCLPDLHVLIGVGGADFDALRDTLGKADAALLFPGMHSQPVEPSLPQVKRQWILLDATWRKARKMLLTTPWLAELPRFGFSNPPTSGYRIRKGPSADSLSTLEAIEHLLTLTAPECDTTALKQGMEALVQAQLRQMPLEVRRRYE